MIFTSDYADVPLTNEPIHDAVLHTSAVQHPGRPAYVDALDGTSITYAQLDADTRRIAAALAEAGVRKGDVLALHSPNTLVFPAVFYGATRAGATVTTINVQVTSEEMAGQLRDSGARWIVTVAALMDTARQAAQATGDVAEIFVCDRALGHRSVLDMRESTAPEPRIDIAPDDVAVMPYSSGTTGTPKGVMLTHRNVGTNAAQQGPLLPTGPEDRILVVTPFSHIYGLSSGMHGPLLHGSTVMLLPQFELAEFLAAIERHRITVLYVAPPVVLLLAKHPDVDNYDLSSLRLMLSGAAPLDAELAAACARRLSLPRVAQAYGMTELSPGVACVPHDAATVPPGTVGKLAPNTQCRVVSTTTGADLATGQVGELLFRGPQVMKGYFGNPRETDGMIDADGWLRTGDLGYIDADGWLYVVDRVKELLKYKGFQVAPAELEGVLVTHPGIADAAVIGIPDDAGNDVPKAFIVPDETGARPSEDDVLTHVAKRVAPYKKIRRVEWIDTVPRAPSGKILRRTLRDAEQGRRTAPP